MEVLAVNIRAHPAIKGHGCLMLLHRYQFYLYTLTTHLLFRYQMLLQWLSLIRMLFLRLVPGQS